MKKILLPILMMLAIVSTSKAQTNALSVADIELPQNYEATLTVSFQFDDVNYTGYSFNLELVDDDDDLEFVMSSGTDVACTNYQTTLGVTANLSEGLVKVAALSYPPVPLKETSGVLLTFTIKPKKTSLTIGKTYTGKIKDIIIVPTEGQKKELAASEFTVTIGNPVELRTVLDENSTTAPVAATGVDVRVNRTLQAGHWGTICLPFAMDADQVKAAFGNDVLLGDFDEYVASTESDEVTGIEVKFSKVTAIEANHPYIIYVGSLVETFTVDGVTINPGDPRISKGYTTGLGKNKVYHPMDFVGTYVADFNFYDDATSYPLFLSGNKFYYATDKTKHLKAYRAYFDFDDYLPEAEPTMPARIYMSFGAETTKIDARTMETIETGKVYNMSGQYVGEAENIDRLPKGIYIVNGKKKVVK